MLFPPVALAVQVAPYTGAWIETEDRHSEDRHSESRPTRARGLKPLCYRLYLMGIKSRPTRARGLKQRHLWAESYLPSVAPYTGAWIETS